MKYKNLMDFQRIRSVYKVKIKNIPEADYETFYRKLWEISFLSCRRQLNIKFVLDDNLKSKETIQKLL